MRLVVLGAFLVGCGGGDLPVKAEFCNVVGKDCSVVARFDTFRHCELFRKYADALCDSASRPGFATCDFTQTSDISTVRCTR